MDLGVHEIKQFQTCLCISWTGGRWDLLWPRGAYTRRPWWGFLHRPVYVEGISGQGHWVSLSGVTELVRGAQKAATSLLDHSLEKQPQRASPCSDARFQGRFHCLQAPFSTPEKSLITRAVGWWSELHPEGMNKPNLSNKSGRWSVLINKSY